MHNKRAQRAIQTKINCKTIRVRIQRHIIKQVSMVKKLTLDEAIPTGHVDPLEAPFRKLI